MKQSELKKFSPDNPQEAADSLNEHEKHGENKYALKDTDQ